MPRYDLKPDARTGRYYVHWYDPATGRTERKSTRTNEEGAAKAWLSKWLIESGRAGSQDTTEFAIVTACQAYWDGHASKLPSAQSADIAITLVHDFFGTDPISALTIPRQEAFVAWLREKGHSSSYISRTLSVLRAALNWCQRRQLVALVPKVIDVPRDDVERFRLSVDQMRGFLAETAKPRRKHLHRWALLSIWTTARPETVFDLGPWAMDFENRLIRLNPPGRQQTKKYRPIVPMCDTAARYMKEWDGNTYVTWGGESVGSLKKGVRAIAKDMGLPIIPRTIRHTMGAELRRRGVPRDEVSGIMGHKWRGASSTTELYAEFDPAYLGNARQAIDDYCKELGL